METAFGRTGIMDPYDCDFCGKPLADPMLAFLDHLDEAEACKFLWQAWRGNVRREAGSS